MNPGGARKRDRTRPERVFLGLGSNLPSPDFGPPKAVVISAVALLAAAGVPVVACSRLYRSTPVPASDQPDFVNAVVEVAAVQEPAAMLAMLHGIEARMGRSRVGRNAARVIDLDLLAYGARVSDAQHEGAPVLPHPRMHLRAFVLKPLAELAPDWRHPLLGVGIAALLRGLPEQDIAEPLAEA
jgi:2-amino-4-hydroxy-6-hydroxymethyldihydropteridine diphosphokinase